MVIYRKLFWTDRGTGSGVPPKVASADMDGSNLKNLYTGNMGNIEFITADIAARKLYWGVPQTGMVRTVLLQYQMFHILSIQMYTFTHLICFGRHQSQPHWLLVQICIAVFMLSLVVLWYRHSFLAIFVTQILLFYCQIECGTMDGVSRVTIVSGLSHPWGITVYQNYLYYTDLDYEVIERVDKNNGADMVVMRSGMAGVRAVKVHARDSE